MLSQGTLNLAHFLYRIIFGGGKSAAVKRLLLETLVGVRRTGEKIDLF